MEGTNTDKTMKKTLILLLTLMPILVHAQEEAKPWKYQMRFGWGGYPVTESVAYTWSWCDCGPRDVNLQDIYWDNEGPLYTTGAISAEFAWLYKDWFTFALATAANITWQNSFDAVTGLRSGTQTGGMLYIVPECRFNWVRRDLVKMYSSVGIGGLIGKDMDNDMAILPVFQVNPVGIEIGRKVFGFCEIGIGMMYTGAMAGVGFRF